MKKTYQDGTYITAKSHPDRQLVVNRYVGMIYYCVALDDPSKKLIGHFETELIPPESKS